MSLSQIHNGRLQYKFDCGSGPGIVSVQSIQVNDGLWHAVSLEVNGNYARLVLDQVHTASGTAPGTLKTLNLDSHVFFGGHVRQQGSRHGRSPQVGNGFRGCMDSIYLNGQELPLNNRPRSYTHIEESVDVSPGCLLAAIEDCSSSPCQNGGVCHPSPTGGKPHSSTSPKQSIHVYALGWRSPGISTFPFRMQSVWSHTAAGVSDARVELGLGFILGAAGGDSFSPAERWPHYIAFPDMCHSAPVVTGNHS